MQGLSGVNSAPLPCAYALYPRVLMYRSHCPPKVNAGPWLNPQEEHLARPEVAATAPADFTG
jgi:hypothetical protein